MTITEKIEKQKESIKKLEQRKADRIVKLEDKRDSLTSKRDKYTDALSAIVRKIADVDTELDTLADAGDDVDVSESKESRATA